MLVVVVVVVLVLVLVVVLNYDGLLPVNPFPLVPYRPVTFPWLAFRRHVRLASGP